MYEYAGEILLLLNVIMEEVKDYVKKLSPTRALFLASVVGY